MSAQFQNAASGGSAGSAAAVPKSLRWAPAVLSAARRYSTDNDKDESSHHSDGGNCLELEVSFHQFEINCPSISIPIVNNVYQS